jgi:hypothetical protein
MRPVLGRSDLLSLVLLRNSRALLAERHARSLATFVGGIYAAIAKLMIGLGRHDDPNAGGGIALGQVLQCHARQSGRPPRLRRTRQHRRRIRFEDWALRKAAAPG